MSSPAKSEDVLYAIILTMKIYLVRHGQTTDNLSKLFHHHGSDLSPQGFKQAEFVADRFKTISIDKVFSSPAKRAEQTAKVIAKTLNLEVELNDLLKELKRPTAIEGMPHQDGEIQKIMTSVKDNFDNPDYKHSDEENFFEFSKRIDKFIESLKKLETENILAVSHEVAIKMIVAKLVFKDLLTPQIFEYFYNSTKMSNTGLTLCEWTEERGWRLITWNDYAHLGKV